MNLIFRSIVCIGADLGFEVENIHHCILPLMQALQQDLKPMKQMTTHPFGKGMHLKQCQIYFQLRDWIRRSKAISYLQRRVSFRFSNSAGQNADNNHATVKNLKLQHPKRNVEREVVKFNGIGELSKYVNEQTMDATYELNTANNNAALPTKTVANDTENKVDKIPIANADLTETGNASGEIETMNGNQRTDAKEFPLSLFINNQQYVFYLPVPDSSSSGITNSEHIQTAIQRLAEEFCRVHGINLLSGFLQENADQFQDPSLLSSLMTERCIHPVGQALLQELQQSVVVE
jgi:hypothetical protein